MFRRRPVFPVLTAPAFIVMSALVLTAGWAAPAAAQRRGRGAAAEEAAEPGSDTKILSGVFTAAQAERGKARFEKTCATCHNFDLKGSGERGPALTGDTFVTGWETRDLTALFTKMQTTMPRGNPSTLPDDAYVDIMTYVLKVNGFPEGKQELTAATASGVQIVRTGGAARKTPNFTLVEMVGCLTQGPDNTWLLTNTGDPVVSTETPLTPEDLKTASARPLGANQFLLYSVVPFKPDTHKGHKVEAKGLFYQAPPNDNRLNVTALQTLAPSCGN